MDDGENLSRASSSHDEALSPTDELVLRSHLLPLR